MEQNGEILLNYQIGPLIGKGGFASIYAIRDIKTGFLWALKEEPKWTPQKILRFEYDVLLQIQSSSYFPVLGPYGESESKTFYVMEILGPSLSTAKRNLKGFFNISTALRASYHVLKGIEAIHNFGFIHRDLKPENILIREGTDYPICIIDFGLAHRWIDTKTGKH